MLRWRSGCSSCGSSLDCFVRDMLLLASHSVCIIFIDSSLRVCCCGPFIGNCVCIDGALVEWCVFDSGWICCCGIIDASSSVNCCAPFFIFCICFFILSSVVDSTISLCSSSEYLSSNLVLLSEFSFLSSWSRMWAVSEAFFSDLHLIWESFFFVAGKYKVRHDTSVVTSRVRTWSNCLSAPFLSAVCGLDYDRPLQRSKNRHVISISSVADLGHRPFSEKWKMRRCGDRKWIKRTWTLGDFSQHVATRLRDWMRLRV